MSTDPLLVRALRGEPTERRPVWLMRQAGRYLPGYQSVRRQCSFLELCRRPDLSAEVSLEPIERFGMDGAIVFSDILIPLEAMGVEVRFGDRGPEIPDPVRDATAVAALRPFDPATGTPWILETIERLVEALPTETPVLGFAGAPFTLATYAVEGRITKALHRVKALRFGDPTAFDALLDHIADQTIGYLAAQARAGARALQLFDTWAGQLSRDDYVSICLPRIRRIFDGVRAELGDSCPPLVLFTKGTSGWIESLADSGADAHSVDWTLPLAEAQDRLGGVPVQGNLDPAILHTTPEVVREHAERLLDGIDGRDGIVVNLGHGVIVETPPENVATFVRTIQGRRVG